MQHADFNDPRKHFDAAEGDRETIEESLRIHEKAARDEREASPTATQSHGARQENIGRALEDLASACLAAEEGFLGAARDAHHDKLRSLFDEYASQSAAFAAELNRVIKRYSGVPGGAGSRSYQWRRMAESEHRHDPALLTEVADEQERRLKQYEIALAADLPGEVRMLVEEQWQAVQQGLMQFRGWAGH